MDAKAGISIPPENLNDMINAIKAIFHMSPKERRILGENGKKYAQKYYDINILAKKLENILLELVEK
jgi:glycosyltransferase involved in cell wall biosynthesis